MSKAPNLAELKTRWSSDEKFYDILTDIVRECYIGRRKVQMDPNYLPVYYIHLDSYWTFLRPYVSSDKKIVKLIDEESLYLERVSLMYTNKIANKETFNIKPELIYRFKKFHNVMQKLVHNFDLDIKIQREIPLVEIGTYLGNKEKEDGSGNEPGSTGTDSLDN